MTRILVVETASPARVLRRIEEMLATGDPAEPEITVLTTQDPQTALYLGQVAGVRVIPLLKKTRKEILRRLRAEKFDLLQVFWTGEKRYRPMKIAALRLRAPVTLVDGGDGSRFRLTWNAFIRFSLFRLQHPLPTDHWDYMPPPQEPAPVPYYSGEKIVIVQSAEPARVLRALERLSKRPLFHNPRYTVFCRNDLEIVRQFTGHPLIYAIRSHSETRGALKHLLELRRERYDAAVVFFTGNPSYWKVKYFAFLLGARHKVVFNENNDCFYFSLRTWAGLLVHRLGERSRLRVEPRWNHRLRAVALVMTKLFFLPFRFAWLLFMWGRLRSSGWRA